MSGVLIVEDSSAENPRVFLKLREVLAILPSRAAKSKWIITPYMDGTEPLIDILTKDRNVLEELAASGARTTFLKLTEAAESVDQVIWGVFSAFDGEGGGAPWCVLTAFDSSYWIVDTDDSKVRRRFGKSFHDVRELSP
jgi:hypothetical protein